MEQVLIRRLRSEAETMSACPGRLASRGSQTPAAENGCGGESQCRSTGAFSGSLVHRREENKGWDSRDLARWRESQFLLGGSL